MKASHAIEFEVVWDEDAALTPSPSPNLGRGV